MEQPQKRKGKVVNTILIVAITFFITSILFTTIKFTTAGDTPLFGIRPMKIISGSMEPTIKTNAYILVQTVSIDDIKQGDIITFNVPEEPDPVTHRVISINDGQIATKGDNNPIPDPWTVTSQNLKYRVIYIANWSVNPLYLWGVAALLLIMITGLIILVVVLSVAVSRKKYKKTKERTAREIIEIIPDDVYSSQTGSTTPDNISKNNQTDEFWVGHDYPHEITKNELNELFQDVNWDEEDLK